MNKKNKSIIIGLVVLILLFIVGIIGKRINEENAVIKKAEVAINNGDYDNAKDILYTVVDGNNKKIDKLWNVVVSYQKAQSSGVDSGLKYLNEIDNSYKKYDRLKNDVDNLKKELLNIKKIRNEFLVKIEEVKSLIEKGEYEKAEELSKETSEWQYIEQADINTMYDLHVKASELLSNQRKDNYAKEEAERKEKEALEKEKQNKLKIETDENNFSKTVAQEMLDKMNADNGNTRNFYELSSDLNIDETGKKYFDVVAKDKDWIKFDDNTILAKYRLYSNGELVEIQQ